MVERGRRPAPRPAPEAGERKAGPRIGHGAGRTSWWQRVGSKGGRVDTTLDRRRTRSSRRRPTRA